MKHYHIQIAEERRSAERATSTAISTSRPTGRIIDDRPEMEAGPTKLYDMGKSVAADHMTNPQLLYIAEWDFVKPYVTVLKGIHADRSLDYMGWPTITEENYVPPSNP